jgi:hypothetical protein
MLSKFRRQGLNVVECEVSPGAGAIEKEVDHCVESSFGQVDKWNDCYILHNSSSSSDETTETQPPAGLQGEGGFGIVVDPA